MSSSKKHQTIFVQLRLGRTSDYHPTIFPLVRDSTALNAGEVYLEYTLDEIIKIKNIADERPNYQKTYRVMKKRYDQLVVFMKKIDEREKTLNPFKTFARYRENRLFIDATSKFRRRAKTTSEMLRRHTQLSTSQFSVISGSSVPVERGDSSTEQKELSGIAIPCDGDIDDKLRGMIEETVNLLTQPNPFDDSAQVVSDNAPTIDPTCTSTSSSSGSAGASRSSTSSNITNVTYIENCHISSSSVSGVDVRSPTLKRLSINAGDHHNDGAVTQNAGSASFSESP